MDAHHVFPKESKLATKFKDLEINPNHPENMKWVQKAMHSGKGHLSHQYSQKWRDFFDINPNATKAQVVNFGKENWGFFKGGT